MVQLLSVLVEDVAVPFDSWNPGSFVNVSHASVGQGLVDGTSLDEFVEVATDDDVGVTVLVENSVDEALETNELVNFGCITRLDSRQRWQLGRS